MFKYLEFAITGTLFFMIARMVKPEIYGNAAPSFMAISYSALVVLGVNQVMIKWHALSEDSEAKSFVVQYNLFYNFFFSIIVFCLLIILLSSEYTLIVAFIAGLKLVQESLINICRARQNLNKINTIYLSFAFVFLIFFILNVEDMYDFFQYWLLSISVSVIVGLFLVLDREIVFGLGCKFYKNLKMHFGDLFRDGLKLAAIGALAPLYLMIDRTMLINFTNVSEAIIGNMQLADNIATILSFGISSVLFITTPNFITKIKSKEIDISTLYSKGYILIGIVLVIVAVCILPGTALINYVFPEYDRIVLPFTGYLISRILFLGLFIPSILSLTYSKETLYMRITYFWFVVLCFINTVLIYNAKPNVLIYAMPFALVFVLILSHVNFYFSFNKKLLTEPQNT